MSAEFRLSDEQREALRLAIMSTSGPSWTVALDTVERIVASEVEAARAEVKHWKDHAEEAGRGFAKVCLDAARLATRNVELRREKDRAEAAECALVERIEMVLGNPAFGYHAGCPSLAVAAIQIRSALTRPDTEGGA